MSTTLPTDSNDRKNYALFSGCLRYFPAALAGVAKTSKLGNDKHNPGQEMHHARNKSGDHGDCIIRHLVDLADLMAAMDRGEDVTKDIILTEVSSMAWRALALSQELHEKFGAPLAPGAKTEKVIAQPAIVPELKRTPMAKFKFEVGEGIVHAQNDGPEVIVYGNFYDADMKPILLIKDSNSKVFQVDPNFYKLAPITAVDEHGTIHEYTRESISKTNVRGIK